MKEELDLKPKSLLKRQLLRKMKDELESKLKSTQKGSHRNKKTGD